MIRVTFRDAEQNIATQTHTFMDIERHLTFPQSGIKMWREKDVICLKAEQFARCVELSGGGKTGDPYLVGFPGQLF